MKKLAAVLLSILLFAPMAYAEQDIEKDQCEGTIQKTMSIDNHDCTLSGMSFLSNGEGYTKLFSGLSISDVQRLWNDIIFFKNSTDVKKINIFINSGGGDAFSGLAIADEILRAKKSGFDVVCHASGIIASAAVPVFAVCSERRAAEGTIFMVHESSLWKWPGQETASDIRAQGELMDILRDRYLSIMEKNSHLTLSEWGEMEGRTTWFGVEKAKDWGIVDKIE